GSIPRQYIPAVDRGIQEAAVRGILAGYPLVDFRAEVFDGSYHSVDSNEMSFKMAGIQGVKAVAPKCKPALLEPLDEIDIVPRTNTWATCSAISRRVAATSRAQSRRMG